jgi:uncharacterized protein (DUF2141 family)
LSTQLDGDCVPVSQIKSVLKNNKIFNLFQIFEIHIPKNCFFANQNLNMSKRYYFILLILVIISSCARVGTPTGGPKDEKPPISIHATPDFESIRFKENKIKIYFDEYIKFKDLNKQLIISPPMKFAPEITPVGTASKFISIKILDTLKENTTYTFNFGNAVTDNSEGNPLKQFKYLFSTGDYIDSLRISGNTLDAFASKNEKSISVLLYEIDEQYSDSTIYKEKPDYLASTLDSTYFEVTNIKAGNYAIFALKDKSNNMIFNPREDKIGFLDHPVQIPGDSIVNMVLSQEILNFKIEKPIEIQRNHIVIGYEGLWNAQINALREKNGNSISYLVQKDRVKDSIHVWYQEVKTDSLWLDIQLDSVVESFPVRLRSKEQDSLNLVLNTKSTLHFRDTITFTSNVPMIRFDVKKFQFIDADSLPVPFQIIEDSNKDKFYIDFEKKASTKYHLIVLPGAITDFFGEENDTIQNTFSVKKLEDYGDLIISVKSKEIKPLIIEVLNEKYEVIISAYCKQNQELKFTTLLPGKYSLRAILDENENLKWDTGSFLLKRQPERVIYYNKTIDLRANWTINEEFNVQIVP